MTNWFKTHNGFIINLCECSRFWYEQSRFYDEIKVFTKIKNDDILIATFTSIDECSFYINSIYKMLAEYQKNGESNENK